MNGNRVVSKEAQPTTRSTRERIKRDLPAHFFEPQPQRALWAVPIIASVVGLGYYVAAHAPPLLPALTASVVIGNSYAMMLLLAHEVLHGSSVRSPLLRSLIGHLGLGPFFISPRLWEFWHNRVHHGHTGQADQDPDLFGTLKRYERYPAQRTVVSLAPGSGRRRSWFFFLYWFTFHGQAILWLQTKSKLFRGFDRGAAVRDTLAIFAFWIAVMIALGPRASLFAVVIPLAIGNAILMSYIATNHFMRPLVDRDDPVESSMSVRTVAVADLLHFNFSHHVEHHLFPRMSPRFAPQLRAWLEEHEPERYLAPAHWRAIAWLYRTPRVHLDATTLCDPSDPANTSTDIRSVEAALRSA